MIIITKICTKCKKKLPLSEFHKRKDSPIGVKAHCKQCASVYKTTYYAKNKEKCKEYNKYWRKENKAHISDTYHTWYLTHKENNRQTSRKRRDKKKSLNESYTIEDEQYTLNLFNHSCANCGSTDNLCIDHHMPLSLGHALTRSNAVLLCRSCNCSKATKLPSEFYDPDVLKIIEAKLNPHPELTG